MKLPKHVTSSFSLLYTTSSFRSVEIFLRGAMGELLAMSILPLILLGFIKLYDSKESWVMLAISMTLLIYTHVLSVAMTMVMIIIALIIQFYRKRK